MATIVKTPSGTWKALIRKRGWPATAKTFRTKRDAEDWSRRAEDEMVRGVYIDRSNSERMTFELVLDRYLAEVTPTKRPSTQRNETCRAGALREFFGKYAMAAITTDLVARLASSLEAIQVPVPSLAIQQSFVALQATVTALKARHTDIREASAILLPATLERSFPTDRNP